MKTITKTATQARKDFFQLIRAARYRGQRTIITQQGKVAAVLLPTEEGETIEEEVRLARADRLEQALKKVGGLFTPADVKAIEKARTDSYVSRQTEW